MTTVETCFGGVWDSPEGRMGRSEVSTVDTVSGGGGTPRGLGESTVDTCFGEGRDASRGERMKNRGSHGRAPKKKGGPPEVGPAAVDPCREWGERLSTPASSWTTRTQLPEQAKCKAVEPVRTPVASMQMGIAVR